MHILILPMYYPEPGAPAHRGYMFHEQAMQIARAGCRVGLVYTEQRLRKDFTWKRFSSPVFAPEAARAFMTSST